MPHTYQDPWTLSEMDLDTAEERWELFEYPVTNMYSIFRPVPNAADMEKEGWHELTTLRRRIAKDRMQTMWFRKL